MAITLRTITGNVTRLLGTPFDPDNVRVKVRSNLQAGEVPIDLQHNALLLGGENVAVAKNGTFAIPNLVDHASADVNPTGVQYQVTIEYLDPTQPVGRTASQKWPKWSSGWLSITGDADLSDLLATQYAPPAYQGDFVDQLEAMRAAASDEADRAATEADRSETAAELARDISNIDSTDAAIDAALQLPGGAAKARLLASIAAMVIDGGAP